MIKNKFISKRVTSVLARKKKLLIMGTSSHALYKHAKLYIIITFYKQAFDIICNLSVIFHFLFLWETSRYDTHIACSFMEDKQFDILFEPVAIIRNSICLFKVHYDDFYDFYENDTKAELLSNAFCAT